MDMLPLWIFDEAWGLALYELVRVEVPKEEGGLEQMAA
jgi:hypothetical protein